MQYKPLPPPVRVAGERDIQVHNVDIDDADNYPGKIISIAFEDGQHIGLQNVTKPAGIVIIGRGRIAQGVSFSPKSSATYIYDLTITSTMHASKAVSCEAQPQAVYYSDPMPDLGTPGFSHFEDCTFGGSEPIMNYRTSYVEGVPGLWPDGTQGRVATKWWVQPKAPRSWGLSGCVFHASQEHALYFHWSHSVDIRDCIFHADGGTAIQAVFRYGRPETGAYHGNPSMSPPAQGNFIIKDCEFRDEDIWSREASALTIVGWPQGDVWIEDIVFKGSRGAIALWTDSFKGQYSRDERGGTYAHILGVDEFDDENIQVQPGGEVVKVPFDEDLEGMPFNDVFVRNITVEQSSNHDREQIMITGVRNLWLENIEVNSFKPKLVIGAQGGGAWKYHDTTICMKNVPLPKYWEGNSYQTLDYTDLPDHWTLVRPSGARKKTRRRVQRDSDRR
jgi:hypothetical protein